MQLPPNIMTWCVLMCGLCAALPPSGELEDGHLIMLFQRWYQLKHGCHLVCRDMSLPHEQCNRGVWQKLTMFIMYPSDYQAWIQFLPLIIVCCRNDFKTHIHTYSHTHIHILLDCYNAFYIRTLYIEMFKNAFHSSLWK